MVLLVRVDAEEDVGNVLKDVVGECLFASRVDGCEICEIENLLLVEKEVSFAWFGVADPLLRRLG